MVDKKQEKRGKGATELLMGYSVPHLYVVSENPELLRAEDEKYVADVSEAIRGHGYPEEFYSKDRILKERGLIKDLHENPDAIFKYAEGEGDITKDERQKDPLYDAMKKADASVKRKFGLEPGKEYSVNKLKKVK
ncbi:hypothetical protein ACFLZX_02530 [Nanoarchaeota archaeon]